MITIDDIIVYGKIPADRQLLKGDLSSIDMSFVMFAFVVSIVDAELAKCCKKTPVVVGFGY